jgi:hypothetical protein
MPDRWTDNPCAMCDRPLHPNDGAICGRCAFDVADEQLGEWVGEGWAAS